jgi:hypothetical protein
MSRKRRLTEEDEHDAEELAEVMLAFSDEHGRAPTMDELKVWWKAHCEAQLRKLIEVVERTGMPVVFENGKYRILPLGTDLARN